MNVLCMDYVHLSELLPTQDMLDEYKKHGGNWDVNFAIIPFVNKIMFLMPIRLYM